jgi:hypothetical protein
MTALGLTVLVENVANVRGSVCIVTLGHRLFDKWLALEVLLVLDGRKRLYYGL